ncbi:MAG: ComEC/Rec2 family competence protein [Treponemataceae bacterium]
MKLFFTFLEKKTNIQILAFFFAVFFYCYFLFSPQRLFYFLFLIFVLACSCIFFLVAKNRFFILLVITVFLIIFSLLRFIKSNQPLQTLHENQQIVKITGKIISNPVMTKNKNYSFFVDVIKTQGAHFSSSAKGKILVFMKATKEFSRTRKADFLIEQGLEADFDVLYIKGNLYKVENISSEKWKNDFLFYRAVARSKLKKIAFSLGDVGGLLLALLSGSRDFLNTDIADNFRKAGLSHVLALSGMHVSLFTSIALILGKFFRSRKIGLLFSLCAVTLFVWFAGLSPSLFRAMVCVFLGVFFSLLFLRIDLVSLISLCFILHVLLFPLDAITIAFLLSYSALLGIATFEPLLTSFFSRFVFLPQKLIALISPSIGANIFTSPLSLYFFSFFTPIGIIATIFVSPLVSVFFILSFICVVVAVIFPASISIFSLLLKGFYFFINILVTFFAKMTDSLF